MDKAQKIEALRWYIGEFKARVITKHTYLIALLWMRAGINPITAASWHRLGYTPDEALARIAAGLTPRQAREADDALIAEHGVIGYTAMMLQLENPGATLIVDPDAGTAIKEIEGR